MKKDEYRTIRGTSESVYKEKGSKFIALAFPVNTTGEVNSKLEEIKKKYHDARHHCYAYRLGTGSKEETRMNDDGEPSGTAGRPIFGQIQSMELTNVLVVVVRYFGGVKLGTGGLIRAYKSAAKEALGSARKVIRVIMVEFSLKFTYPLLNEVMRIIKEEDVKIEEQNFGESCHLKISVRKEKKEKIFERFSSLFGVDILRTNTN